MNSIIYIIFGVFFNILVYFIFGFDYDEDFKILLLFPSEGQKKLYKHFTVHEIFRNIGVFIFGCAFYKFEKILNKKEITFHKTPSNSSKESNNQIILIFNDSQEEIGSISILNFIFVISTYVCIEYLSDIYYNLKLRIFDFWMFELLIISYINAKMFKLKIFRHQMLAIFFNSFICLLFRLPSFILSFSFSLKDKNGLYTKSNWFIVLGLIVYVIIITIRSYSYTKMKWFIDLKYISLTKLLISIGFIGIFVSSISCIIQTYIKCSSYINFCEVVKEFNNTTNNYLDNFIIYTENVLGKREGKSIEIILESCVILFGMICKFFALYYNMLIIKFLTPVHIIFDSSIFYFIIKIIALFYNRIRNKYFFNSDEEIAKIKCFSFILDIIGNFISIFGFLIYLELIELGFCKLNYNLRKTIAKRSIDDIRQSIAYEGFNEEDEKSESKNTLISELETNTL